MSIKLQKKYLQQKIKNCSNLININNDFLDTILNYNTTNVIYEFTDENINHINNNYPRPKKILYNVGEEAKGYFFEENTFKYFKYENYKIIIASLSGKQYIFLESTIYDIKNKYTYITKYFKNEQEIDEVLNKIVDKDSFKEEVEILDLWKNFYKYVENMQDTTLNDKNFNDLFSLYNAVLTDKQNEIYNLLAEIIGTFNNSKESPKSDDLTIKQIKIKDNNFKGLPNYGNTCFLNAAIQCLLQIQRSYNNNIFEPSTYGPIEIRNADNYKKIGGEFYKILFKPLIEGGNIEINQYKNAVFKYANAANISYETEKKIGKTDDYSLLNFDLDINAEDNFFQQRDSYIYLKTFADLYGLEKNNILKILDGCVFYNSMIIGQTINVIERRYYLDNRGIQEIPLDKIYKFVLVAFSSSYTYYETDYERDKKKLKDNNYNPIEKEFIQKNIDSRPTPDVYKTFKINNISKITNIIFNTNTNTNIIYTLVGFNIYTGKATGAGGHYMYYDFEKKVLINDQDVSVKNNLKNYDFTYALYRLTN